MSGGNKRRRKKCLWNICHYDKKTIQNKARIASHMNIELTLKKLVINFY